MSGASADAGEKAMNFEPCELGPYRPVAELQVLAAVERAQRHLDKVFHRDVAEHLGFAKSGTTTKRLCPQLESLRDDGSLASERINRLSAVWTITRRGPVEPLELLAVFRRTRLRPKQTERGMRN
jgi:hypothetical protein